MGVYVDDTTRQKAILKLILGNGIVDGNHRSVCFKIVLEIDRNGLVNESLNWVRRIPILHDRTW